MAEPTMEQWRDLYAAFKEYCEAAPWERLEDSDLITVEHPSGEYKGYCVVLGAGGINYGLAVYIGDQGLAGYMRLITGVVDHESEDSLYEMDSLSALLADREHLDPPDRGVIRSLGLRFRGRGRWPQFRRTIPGYLPWYLDSDEAVFLTNTLKYVAGVAPSAGRGPAVYPVTDSGIILPREFRDGAWQDPLDLLELSQRPQPVFDYPDPDRLQRLSQSKPMSSLVWEMDVFHIGSPVQDKKGERPYFPSMFFVVDSDSSMPLKVDFLGANPSPSERQDELVKFLENMASLPSEIIVNSTDVADWLGPVTESVGIKLTLEATPALDGTLEELMGFVEE